ncbi:hypothetical protein [Colwellia sp. 12G3]|uniref:hypothetical protein n=1 Tax=Colwellia sp. 12G3 TaxID=2058299 RepID=UPI000C33CE82|nr:hypothetical protein [Colwellia sp. 12G3]PKI13035.1 hypothetical protein CXF71_20235 [Colwellia sp. 12G3]
MTETLPITINVNTDLLDKFSKLKSVSNKLEAQFNFQTLTANWYGDEEDILIIHLCLETPASFNQRQEEFDQLSLSDVSVSHFSDDVISCFNKGEQQLLCVIAITTSELELLTLQPRLLTGFIQAKLHKVLNLIAQQQSLASI